MTQFKKGDTVRRYRGGNNEGVKQGDTFVVTDVDGSQVQGGPNSNSRGSGWHDSQNLELVSKVDSVINDYPIY